MIRNCILLVLLTNVLAFTSCKQDEVLEPEYYSCSIQSSDSSSNNDNHLKYQNLLEEITGAGVPGILMSITTPEGGMWNGGAGKADLKNKLDLQPCNITRVGSTVKTFTAATILILQEEGKLSLDDKITQYLSEKDLKGVENADKATIRQLLNHSSGIYNYIRNVKFQTASLNDLIKEWRPEELLSYARGKSSYFAPGEDVLYSNTNYIYLGMIISKIEGKPFYKVFEEKIFRPLGLNSTRFASDDPVPAGIIRGYIDFYSNLNVINSTYYSGWDYYTADGGLISNASDLNKFITALCRGEIISQASLDQVLSFREPSETDKDFFPVSYGMGIFAMDTPWGKGYFHSGDAIGYYACMVYFPEKETTISWAVNGNYGKIDKLTSSKSAMEKIFSTVFD